MPNSLVTTHPATLRLVQRCNFGDVYATVEAVRNFLTERGCGVTELSDIELALVEGCNNAVRYAPPATHSQPITVECLCAGDNVELRIHDHTAGFDWPARASLPAPESESGRGIFLMRSLMHGANYFRSAGENVLILQKKISPVRRPAPSMAEQESIITEMVEELSSCYESLSAIFRYSAAHAGGELREFAQRVLADLQQITGANWYVLRLAAGDRPALEVFVASDSALSLPALSVESGPVGTMSVEQEAALKRRDVWFDASYPLSPGDPLANIKPEAHGLVHPFFAGGTLVGTLALGKNRLSATGHARGLAFTAGQTNVVGTFSEFLAIQVLNARIQEEQVASRLVARELEIANNIQQSLLPRELPRLTGFQLAAGCRSARQVGGDFYDALRVSDHEVLLVIADVMGKGVPAAMFAAILRTMVRAAPELSRQPAALLARVNQLLFDELSGVDMFITAQLACFNSTTGRLAVANAGHCPLLIATAGGEGVREISAEGMPLGVQADTRFSEKVLQLPSRSCVLLYTDGLTETLNPQGECLGADRLAAWFQTNAGSAATAEDLKRSLSAMLTGFQANQALNDDQTFLIMSG